MGFNFILNVMNEVWFYALTLFQIICTDKEWRIFEWEFMNEQNLQHKFLKKKKTKLFKYWMILTSLQI